MYFKRSPCIGVCDIAPSSPYCRGCMRDADDLSQWQNLSFAEKKSRWLQMGERRSAYPGPSIIRDQLRRWVTITTPVQRIISLVPSLTQTLYDLDLGSSLIGTTVFCPKPAFLEADKLPTAIGGTKKLNLVRIRNLQPDFIIANKEENIQQDVETLAAEFPVWISDVTTVEAGQNLIWLLGEYLDRQNQALAIVDGIREGLARIATNRAPRRYVYLIWKKPWMVAAGATYIDSWLQTFGLVNCFAELQRYPAITLEQLVDQQPEIVLLPDEPYRFTEKDRQHLQLLLPASKILFVVGKYTSWYGSPMLEGIPYLTNLLAKELHVGS